MKIRGFIIIVLVLLVALPLTPNIVRAQEPVVEEWVVTYDGPGNDPDWDSDWASGVAVDNYGNVYVTGTSDCSHNSCSDIMVLNITLFLI